MVHVEVKKAPSSEKLAGCHSMERFGDFDPVESGGSLGPGAASGASGSAGSRVAAPSQPDSAMPDTRTGMNSLFIVSSYLANVRARRRRAVFSREAWPTVTGRPPLL